MDYYHYIVSNQWPPFRSDIHKRRASSAPCLTMARTSSRSSSPDPPQPSLPPSSPSGSFRPIKPLPPLGETLRIVPFVSLCAMVGVLTRIGLDELFGPNVLDVTSTESATFPDWFPNAWGSFVMGFFVPMRQSPFFARCALPSCKSEGMRRWLFVVVLTAPLYVWLGRHPWLYVGLTTGYCGCTTTFSSWNQDAAAFVVSSADVRSLSPVFRCGLRPSPKRSPTRTCRL
jgi:fluoride ion exporter CrcB/FEX